MREFEIESDAASCQWVSATNADVARDGMVPRYRQLLGRPVGTEVVEKAHTGRLWKLRVISKASGLTTFAKDVRGWVCPRPARSCRLTVPEVLNRFVLDSDALLPIHRPVIARIARCVAASTPAPVRFIRVVGHADRSGTHPYNVALGMRRAQNVRVALQRAIDGIRPGLSHGIRFHVQSRGDWQQISPDNALDRRVEVFVAQPAHMRPGCGGSDVTSPAGSGVHHEEARRGRPRPRPRPVVAVNRLVFYQNDPEHNGEHFHTCARLEARRIRALATPSTNRTRSVGPIPYTSGQDILDEIAAAVPKVGTITRIHVFGHAGPRGIGGVGAGQCGMYMPGTITPTTGCGGVLLTALTRGTLTNDVTFVLHGCRLAGNKDHPRPDDFECTDILDSDENFARSLYRHLRTGLGLTQPNVFGHCSSGCSGRDTNWREYSNAHPNGRRASTLGALYERCSGCSRRSPRED
jgi:outer membrane protein OmpA-like peptidoglycan-associated protein